MNLIIGRKPVLEALNSNSNISQVYIQYGQRGSVIEAIIVAAKKKGIKVSQVSIDKFKKFTTDKNSQGVIAIRSDFEFFSLDEVINESKRRDYPLILILDSIQDPHNIGAILRTAECAGVKSIIITMHNSAPINETVVKTSAGAIEHLKICRVHNLSVTIDQLKEEGFWIIGSSLTNSKNYLEFDFKIPIALIVGNEEKGIRKLTASKCDYLIHLPMYGKIQSLNVSVATGIFLYEILRQQKSTLLKV
jgi:23S rRNA (guanosine2251-2'-O)-methyltransferase